LFAINSVCLNACFVWSLLDRVAPRCVFAFLLIGAGGGQKLLGFALPLGVSKFISEIIEAPSQVVKNFRIRS
jgi:hypothetical protein